MDPQDQMAIPSLIIPVGIRPSWDHYFMSMALVASTRGTCDRKRVGAILVRDNFTLATGYNGAISGTPNCDEAGHDMEDGHCVRTIHAEQNALLQAAKHGAPLDGATCYSTASPCWPCFRLLVQAGVKLFVYNEAYRAEDGEGRVKWVQQFKDVRTRILGSEKRKLCYNCAKSAGLSAEEYRTRAQPCLGGSCGTYE